MSQYESPSLVHGDQLFEEGQYGLALVRYENFMLRYPDSPHSEYLQYRKLQCHLRLSDYFNAVTDIEKYLKKYPQGRFKAETVAAQEMIAEIRDTSKVAKRTELVNATDELKKVEEQLKQTSSDGALLFKQGNLLWTLGRYYESADAYQQAIDLEVAYLQNPFIRGRVRFDNTDRAYPITPLGIEGTVPARSQVQVTNLVTYLETESEGAAYSRQLPSNAQLRRYIVIAGTAVNDGPKRIENLSLQITFYNAVDEIRDVVNIAIGSLNIFEERNFVGRSYNMEGFETPDTYIGGHYEIKPIF